MKLKGTFKNWRTELDDVDMIENEPFMSSLFLKPKNKNLPEFIQAIDPTYIMALVNIKKLAIKHRLKIVGSEHLRKILNQYGWKNGLVLTSGNEDDPVIITNDTFDRAVLLAPQTWKNHPKLSENSERRESIINEYMLGIIKKGEVIEND